MDPISTALQIALRIAVQAKKAVTNNEECDLLADLTSRTLPMLRHMEQRPMDDPAVLAASEEISLALEEAECAITDCVQSTVLVSMVRAENHKQMLREAAVKLEHALDQLPVATLGLTAEIHDCLTSMKEDLRHAKFQERAKTNHLMHTIKTEMERAFNENRKTAEDTKQLIREMLEENSKTTEERTRDVELLREYLKDARKNKQDQEAFELQQIIDVVTESLADSNPQATSNVVQGPIGFVSCPIGMEVIRDPVLLVDSGVTYERACIEEWIQRGHQRDPVTRAEIKSGKLIPNLAIKRINGEAFEHDTELETSAGTSTPAESVLVPGIYEGYGKYRVNSEEFKYQFMALVLEPDGNVLGYSISQSKEPSMLLRERLIVKGRWSSDKDELDYEDSFYVNRGVIKIDSTFCSPAFSLSGSSTPLWMSVTQDEVEFVFPCLSPPTLMQHNMLMPGWLQLEGSINYEGKRCLNRLVLLLNADMTLRGWLSIAEASVVQHKYGHVLSGTWSGTGDITFLVFFPLSQDRPIESAENPSNFLAEYKFVGECGPGVKTIGRGNPEFKGVYRRMRNDRHPDLESSEPLLGIGTNAYFEFVYEQLRRPSINIPTGYHGHAIPLRLPTEPGNVLLSSYTLLSDDVAERWLRPGIFTIRTRNHFGHENDTWTLIYTRYYARDIARTASGCAWSTARYGQKWMLEDAGRPGEYLLMTCENVQDGGAGEWVKKKCYLTVALGDEFKEPRKSRTYYAVVHPDRDSGCIWNVSYNGSKIIATVSSRNRAELAHLFGFALSKCDFNEEKRDRISCFAVVGADSSKAMEMEFDYAFFNCRPGCI